MKKDEKGKVSILQKKIKRIIGLFGGTVITATFLMGLYMMISLALVGIGCLVIGTSLLEILLVKLAVNSVNVYSVEEKYDENSGLTLIKIDNGDKSQHNKIEFTKIEPMVHLEIVNSNGNDKGYVRRRNIDKK